LKEADVQLEAHNQEKIDKIIHKYIGEQSSYGRCSADWKKASKEIKANPEMKNDLISKLKA
jgi:ABC-type iron transport system FetAB ATPase subunit